ncbi:hypothetical protein EYF80_012220 [Liparis tanakae]|uniref:Uncharacterized protein n=1 Tax=Liparis tanakae TaxID=230148 RepID=A0A4Z2II22_9TELE|nr:hypothetical protein EYF80_012220 [Liparis tanakae]
MQPVLSLVGGLVQLLGQVEVLAVQLGILQSQCGQLLLQNSDLLLGLRGGVLQLTPGLLQLALLSAASCLQIADLGFALLQRDARSREGDRGGQPQPSVLLQHAALVALLLLAHLLQMLLQFGILGLQLPSLRLQMLLLAASLLASDSSAILCSRLFILESIAFMLRLPALDDLQPFHLVLQSLPAVLRKTDTNSTHEWKRPHGSGVSTLGAACCSGSQQLMLPPRHKEHLAGEEPDQQFSGLGQMLGWIQAMRRDQAVANRQFLEALTDPSALRPTHVPGDQLDPSALPAADPCDPSALPTPDARESGRRTIHVPRDPSALRPTSATRDLPARSPTPVPLWPVGAKADPKLPVTHR